MREDLEENFAGKSECWMKSEYDKKLKDYCKNGYGNYIVKLVDDAGLEDDLKTKIPCHYT